MLYNQLAKIMLFGLSRVNNFTPNMQLLNTIVSCDFECCIEYG